jgi:hypothetical protein
MSGFFVSTHLVAKVRINLILEEEINLLLDRLAKEQHRKRSAIVTLALLAFAEKSRKRN